MTALSMVAGVALGVLGLASDAGAQPPTVVSVTVNAGTSDPGGITPTTAGNNYFYDYAITDGAAIVDFIPVEVCAQITSDGPGAGYPFQVSLSVGGGNVPGVTTVSTPLTFTADGCQGSDGSVGINLNTGVLLASVGNYDRLVQVDVDNEPSRTNVNVDKSNIHVRVRVAEAEDSITCFMTDSSFGFLLDCDGNMVTLPGNDGRFAIVSNKKGTQVATNPGQFYYNVLWTNNTGVDQTVTVQFLRNNVNPKGAQAIHAKLFESFPALTPGNFDLVNDEIPSGSDDTLHEVLVPANWTLWVDYHLEWGELGSLLGAAANTCGGANKPFSIRAAVSNSDGPLDECVAGAIGYSKK